MFPVEVGREPSDKNPTRTITPSFESVGPFVFKRNGTKQNVQTTCSGHVSDHLCVVPVPFSSFLLPPLRFFFSASVSQQLHVEERKP